MEVKVFKLKEIKLLSGDVVDDRFVIITTTIK